MDKLYVIILVIFGVAFLVIIPLIKGIKKGFRKYKTTPEDELFDLSWKIDNAMLDANTELYLIRQIKEFKLRQDINQDVLNDLDIKFRQKFQRLHP